MGKRAPSAPPPPDPVATARAQAEFNTQAARENAELNRVNQVTPQGTLTWRQRGPSNWNEAAYLAANPDVAGSGMSGLQHYTQYGRAEGRGGGVDPNFSPGGWEQTVELSPEQRRLYDLSTAGQELYGQAALSQLRGVQDTLSRPFEFNGPAMTGALPDRTFGVAQGYFDRNREFVRGVQDRTGQLQSSVDLSQRPDFSGIGDPNQSRAAVQQALLSRINPDLERDRAALESRLAAQGITMGSEAWNTGMQDWARMANDARFGAVLNAGQEQSRVFGLGLQQAGFGNDARLQQATFGNQAASQAQGMDLDRATFANQTTSALNQADAARLGFQNQAAQQIFGMDLGRATFGNQARQQSLQEQMALRAQPLNEAAALLSGQQVQQPQFSAIPQVQVQAPDYQGAVGQNYAGANSQWNARTQMAGSNNAAIASGVGSALSVSAAAIFA